MIVAAGSSCAAVNASCGETNYCARFDSGYDCIAKISAGKGKCAGDFECADGTRCDSSDSICHALRQDGADLHLRQRLREELLPEEERRRPDRLLCLAGQVRPVLVELRHLPLRAPEAGGRSVLGVASAPDRRSRPGRRNNHPSSAGGGSMLRRRWPGSSSSRPSLPSTLSSRPAATTRRKGAASASATAQAPTGRNRSAAAGIPNGSATAKPPGGQNAELLIDPEGPYLAGTRIDLAAAGGKEKLARVIGGLQVDGKVVSMNVEKKAKVPIVAEVIGALGKAGASKIIVKTNGRGDLPKEVTFTPESRVSNPPACSVAAMVLKTISTAIWPMKGGTGKRHRKGFAGPDLTHTQEALEKDLEHCESTVAFVSADDGVPWEDAFNIAGTVLKSDGKKRVDSLVLLHEAPVAGRPITLVK